MKISILTPSLSGNCLGRAYLLAKILQRRYEIEIIGPKPSGSIWGPLQGDTVKFIGVDVKGLRSYQMIKALTREVSGDVIYASKPLSTSFGVGIIKKITDKTPLVLDIDDWEMGFSRYYHPRIEIRYRMARNFTSIDSFLNILIHEKLVFQADAVTVSNTYLQKKFGGRVIWHGRDTNEFDPENFDKHKLRHEYGIDKDKKVVGFLGTPNPYKGLEDLAEAIRLVGDKNMMLMIIGFNDGAYSKRLKAIGQQLLQGRFLSVGQQPFGKIPEFLCMSDIVAIPQRRNSATVGQLPAKVFDAMAMAKPIIATRVNDLPMILDDCGWTIEPENPKQLAAAISDVFNNRQEAIRRGRNARNKCIMKYSWDAIEEPLVRIFRDYE